MRPLVIAALCIASSAGAQSAPSPALDSARARLSQLDGTIRVAGLDSAVEVRRDRWGVPHIYARTQHDLFFAQGFVAAQDRLWQMEMWRRTGQGRLAEVLGPEHVERDRFARLLRYRGDMEREWSSYAPDARAIATAFTDGVNAWVALVRQRPPIEYTVLGFEPTPWRPEDVLNRMAALAMTGNALSEMSRARIVAAVGAERANAIWPPDPVRALDPAPGLDLRGLSPASLGAAEGAYGPIAFPQPRDGSNNWVVSGERTASGKPLLANDPHRRLAVPALRYLTHLVAPGWNVIGAGEPALPGVAAGHNDRIAFGFTIVGMDQQDVYVEKVGPCPAASAGGARCWRSSTGWKPVRTELDTIRVKGAPPRVVRHEFTDHGPIVAEDSAGRAFVIRFVGSEPGTAGYLANLSIARARDWKQFREAAARWHLPTENLVYADVDGNIGWIAAGLMPRRSWSGMLPVPGDAGLEWQGFLPADSLPSQYNPADGVLATANNNILPPGYRHTLSHEWDAPFRAERIRAQLRSRRGWTREQFEQLQHDEYSVPARRLVPLLLRAVARHGRSSPEIELLGRWDFVMHRDSAAPLVHTAWVRALQPRVAAMLTPGAADAFAADLDVTAMLRALERPGRAFGPRPEDRRDSLLLGALAEASDTLVRRFGAERARWRWGSGHVASFAHPLVSAYDLPAIRRGGDGWTINATWGPDYRQTVGATFRQVIDLADWDNSTATSAPGQSGQPGSAHYGDLLPLWEHGRYFPLLYSRAAVERETVHLLMLEPGLR